MKGILTLFFALAAISEIHSQTLSGTWLATYRRDEPGNKRLFYYRLSLNENMDSLYGFCEAFNALSDVNHVPYEKMEVVAVYKVYNYEWNSFDTADFELLAENIAYAPENNIPPVFMKMFCKIVSERSFDQQIIYSGMPVQESIIGELFLTKISDVAKSWSDNERLSFKTIVPKRIVERLSLSFLHRKEKNEQNKEITIIHNKSLQERFNEVQSVIETDSLVADLSLYDNGIIDDDTVSLYMNDSVLISQQRITEKPIHLQVKLEPEKEYRFILFAHNLGRIAPNTAELLLNFGNEKHRINLSSSLDKNAVFIIKTF